MWKNPNENVVAKNQFNCWNLQSILNEYKSTENWNLEFFQFIDKFVSLPWSLKQNFLKIIESDQFKFSEIEEFPWEQSNFCYRLLDLGKFIEFKKLDSCSAILLSLKWTCSYLWFQSMERIIHNIYENVQLSNWEGVEFEFKNLLNIYIKELIPWLKNFLQERINENDTNEIDTTKLQIQEVRSSISKNPTIKLLLVDDSIIDLTIQRKLSEKSYDFLEIETARSFEDIKKMLNNMETWLVPDLIFLDYHIWDTNGIEILKTIREISSETRIVMVTSLDQKDQRNAHLFDDIFKYWANDCLEKTILLNVLQQRLKLNIEEVVNKKKIRHLNELDPKTKLLDGRYMKSYFNMLETISKNNDKKLGVLLMDLNKFKPINDIYWHLCGDEILAEVWKRLNSILRLSDIPARDWGDEFLILVGWLEDEKSLKIIENKIMTIFLEPFKIHKDWEEISIYISGSVGSSISWSEYTFESLKEKADDDMFKKKKERNISR